MDLILIALVSFAQAIMTGKGDETLLNLAYLDNVSDMALIVLAKKCSSKYNHPFFNKNIHSFLLLKKNNPKSFFLVGNITKHMKGVLRVVNLSACRLITDRGLKYMQPLIEISKEASYICVKQIYLPSATVVAERLCFHKRLSFCPTGERGRCTPHGQTSPLGRHPRADTPSSDTPPGQTPPWADTPWADWADTPWADTPLQWTVRIL